MAALAVSLAADNEGIAVHYQPKEGAAPMRVIECDVVVVGGGGAGTYAALRLHALGLKPMLISKGLVGKSGASIMAGAVIVGSKMLGGTEENAASSLEFFAKYYSHFLVDQSYLAAAGEWIENTFYPEMESLGLLFSRDDNGNIAMSHSPVRWAVAPMQGQTGILLMDIRRKQLQALGIPMHEECVVTSLLRNANGDVCGLVALDYVRGELFAVQAKAVVMATGHADRLVRRSTGTREQTGDGIALALRAGAEMTNLEMQFWHISDFANPPTWQRLHIYPNPLVGTDQSSRVYNAQGECFFEQSRDAPAALAPYTLQVKRLTQQVLAGKARFSGGYFTSYSHVDADVLRRYQYAGSAFEKLGLDITQDKVEARTTMHYRQGGIESDPHSMRTSVAGLWVAGGVGAHVTGSLAVAIYDGGLAAESVAGHLPTGHRHDEFTAQQIREEASRVEGLRVGASAGASAAQAAGQPGIAPMHVKTAIWDLMGEAYGLIKSGQTMRDGLARLDALRERELPRMTPPSASRCFNTAWLDALDVHNLIDVCDVTLRSALRREESRGSFYRTDFPYVDNTEWQCKNIVARDGADYRFRKASYPVGTIAPDFARQEYFSVPW
ncbi:FAD-binding protein [Pandoraea sp. ISTKB]|uniref:FAD-binding protein n=1 Tax=Pandoraea sp. ISTKB TaxID=1586708 RepID=UPI000ACD4AEE|nr:FAD-binding protein [Pandoraea sp. ISTKB]